MDYKHILHLVTAVKITLILLSITKNMDYGLSQG